MTLEDLARTAELVTLHEGVRKFPYVDTVGKTTIGIGRNLTDRGLRPQEIQFLFTNDLEEAREELFKCHPWVEELDPVRQAALIDMMFNLGVGRFLKFKQTLRAIRMRDWPDAARHLKHSRWWTQVGSRARRIHDMILTGCWPPEIQA